MITRKVCLPVLICSQRLSLGGCLLLGWLVPQGQLHTIHFKHLSPRWLLSKATANHVTVTTVRWCAIQWSLYMFLHAYLSTLHVGWGYLTTWTKLGKNLEVLVYFTCQPVYILVVRTQISSTTGIAAPVQSRMLWVTLTSTYIARGRNVIFQRKGIRMAWRFEVLCILVVSSAGRLGQPLVLLVLGSGSKITSLDGRARGHTVNGKFICAEWSTASCRGSFRSQRREKGISIRGYGLSEIETTEILAIETCIV